MRLSRIKADVGRRSRAKLLRALSVPGALALMAAASACSAQGLTANKVELLCTVDGAKLLPSGTDEAALCAEMQREIDTALAPRSTVKSVARIGSADWIKVEVRLQHKPATASARIIQKTGSQEIVHPEIAVDVMDKALGRKEMKRLVTEVARSVAKAAGK